MKKEIKEDISFMIYKDLFLMGGGFSGFQLQLSLSSKLPTNNQHLFKSTI